jgi:lipid A 3-O-deacylase
MRMFRQNRAGESGRLVRPASRRTRLRSTFERANRSPASHAGVWGAILLVAASSAAMAQQPTMVTVAVDNDWFAHQDRHYTSGSQIAFARDRETLPDPLRSLAPFRWSADRAVVFSIGQRIYTPGNTNPKPDEPADRPYAGWVYVQTDVRASVGPVVDRVTGTLGYIGPAAGARQVQRISHHIFGSREFTGWDQQLRGEPTVSVAYERAWPGLVSSVRGGTAIDFSPYAGATLGTPYTFANAGVVARWGRNLPDDLPTARISLGTSGDGYRGGAARGWYVWLGVDARAVGWNVFLDGNTFRDSPAVERKVFQHDVAIGAVIAWPRGRLGLTMVQRSREFDGQRGPDRFGQLSVSFAY